MWQKILLTASGGPFPGKEREELVDIQVEDALKHPNWEMGQKDYDRFFYYGE